MVHTIVEEVLDGSGARGDAVGDEILSGKGVDPRGLVIGAGEDGVESALKSRGVNASSVASRAVRGFAAMAAGVAGWGSTVVGCVGTEPTGIAVEGPAR